eukprot:TRINITY_DN11011_c0_g1_i1.p1 TRINITY_DN11011_c0_g1~~TRINITY_DN11011_c0_g1_i1.p1  ORF type:complete len:769 (-),score=320.14 TRINITY_DN11011_c0_g1_i1:6-2312(-)
MGRDRREKDRDDSRGKDRDRRDSRSDDRDRDRRKDRDSKDSRDRRDRDKDDKRESRRKDRDDKEEGDEDMPAIASEVSLSVEATNALRISLGLKPLHVPDPKEAEEKEQARLKAIEERQKAEKSAAIKQKLVDMKSDRQHQTFVGSKSIAEEIDDEDASAWLSKAKTIQSDEMEKEKQKAARRRREMEELEAQYTSSDLTGLKISHAMSEFENGGPVILTLADTSILNQDGGINEDDDELENVNIAEKQRRAKAEKEAKAPKKYDDQFDGDKKPMLHHYDKQDDTKKLYIGETGNVTQHAEEVKKKLAILEDADQMSLDAEKKIASEYFTKAEMAQFKKPSKKKRKTRNQSTLDEISQEVENASAASSDHGSRFDGGAKLKRDVEKEIATQTKKSKGYQAALTRGAAETKILFDDKDDGDLLGTDRRDLSAKRKMEMQMQNDRLEEKIRQRKAKEEKLDLTNIGGDAGLMFTPTTEFIRLVQPVSMEEIMEKPLRKKRDALDAKIEAQVEADADEYERSMRSQAKKERVNKPIIKEENDMDIDDDKPPALAPIKSEINPDASDDGESDHTLEKVMEEPAVATGIYATLAFLREKGSQETKLETMSGRKNDLQVDYALAAHDPAPGIRLDYIDEFGRQMTPKEAFRALSHKFHGKMPGKNKQDKRLKAHLEQQRMLKMSNTDTPLGTAKILRQETERTQLPYVVLSGGGSVNRDTSEPAVLIQDNLSNVEIKKTRRDMEEDAPPIPEAKPTNVLQGEFSGFKLAIGKKK